jgi:hypothetical protein
MISSTKTKVRRVGVGMRGGGGGYEGQCDGWEAKHVLRKEVRVV